MSFETFPIDPRIVSAVRTLGWDKPTEIQRRAIPDALAGRDLTGLAQTGTGKTAAFAIPILQRLLSGPRGRVRTLVLAPTRELADQICGTFAALGRGAGLRAATVYGGVGAAPQVRALRDGAEIIVACPGRLLDLMGQGQADLSRVEVLVIDEADRMFDMGFLPDVRRVLRALPARRQTLLFSATMPPEVRSLAAEVLRDPVTVQIGLQRPAHTVAHALYPVAPHLKSALLLELLRRTDTGSVIVFTRTKHRAKKVARQLGQAGHRATSLQGNLSQNRRREALEGFRRGEYTVMVATDIASRGIDVTQISHVVNYDIPDTVDAYTHRIGRTGRLERTGDAFTLVTTEDGEMVRAIERVLGEPLERRRLEGFDYAAPATEAGAAPPPRGRVPHAVSAGRAESHPRRRGAVAAAAGHGSPRRQPQPGRTGRQARG